MCFFAGQYRRCVTYRVLGDLYKVFSGVAILSLCNRRPLDMHRVFWGMVWEVRLVHDCVGKHDQ